MGITEDVGIPIIGSFPENNKANPDVAETKAKILEFLTKKQEPTSTGELIGEVARDMGMYGVHYHQRELLVSLINVLIAEGKVILYEIKWEHPGGISSFVPMPYLRLKRRPI